MLCQCRTNTLHIHPVNIAQGGDPPVHVVLQVEELGVRELAQRPNLRAGPKGAGSRCWALAEDIIKTIVHCLGLQWESLFLSLFKFRK